MAKRPMWLVCQTAENEPPDWIGAVTVGVHCQLRILGISVITDICLPDALEPASLEDIIATANAAEKKLRVLVRRVVERL